MDGDNPQSAPGTAAHLGLVVRHIAGSQSALYAYVCSLLGTSRGAADVLQEANVVLWEKAGEYDPARPFLPWAYRVAHFQVLAHRKRQARDRLVFDDELLAAVDAAIRRRDERADRELEALDGCVGKLTAGQRAVLDARYRDGESVEVIAGRSNKAPNALSAELYRLRKALMDCVRRALGREETA
ncbi:MAG: sigma-70 family RNA polymerase sigma factor [Phycisphaerae bacterium]